MGLVSTHNLTICIQHGMLPWEEQMWSAGTWKDYGYIPKSGVEDKLPSLLNGCIKKISFNHKKTAQQLGHGSSRGGLSHLIAETASMTTKMATILPHPTWTACYAGVERKITVEKRFRFGRCLFNPLLFVCLDCGNFCDLTSCRGYKDSPSAPDGLGFWLAMRNTQACL